MADSKDEQNETARIELLNTAFRSYIHVKDQGSDLIIQGVHVTKFAASKYEDGWQLVVHLVDGSSHALFSIWSKNFLKTVFDLEQYNK